MEHLFYVIFWVEPIQKLEFAFFVGWEAVDAAAVIDSPPASPALEVEREMTLLFFLFGFVSSKKAATKIETFLNA